MLVSLSLSFAYRGARRPFIWQAASLDFVLLQPAMILKSTNQIIQRGRLIHDQVIVERRVQNEPMLKRCNDILGPIFFDFIIEVPISLGVISEGFLRLLPEGHEFGHTFRRPGACNKPGTKKFYRASIIVYGSCRQLMVPLKGYFPQTSCKALTYEDFVIFPQSHSLVISSNMVGQIKLYIISWKFGRVNFRGGYLFEILAVNGDSFLYIGPSWLSP